MSKKKTLSSYEVGYGKPPKNRQFQKGVSGNPTGRPKKSLDFDQELIRESQSHITINDNGRRSRISKFQGILKQLHNKALIGNISASRIYFDLLRQAHERGALPAGTQPSDVEYKAEDLTDDQLTEIMMTGSLRKPPIKIGKGNASNTE